MKFVCPCGREIIQDYVSCGGKFWHPKCWEIREEGWRAGYESGYKAAKEERGDE